MAGTRFTLLTGTVAVVASTGKTMWQVLAPTNQMVRVERLRIFGLGSNSADVPVQFDLLEQSTGGTMTALAVQAAIPCLRPLDSLSTLTLQTTGSVNSTAEGTAGNVKYTFNVHPQSQVDFVFPIDRPFFIKQATRLALRVPGPGQNGNFNFLVEFEE